MGMTVGGIVGGMFDPNPSGYTALSRSIDQFSAVKANFTAESQRETCLSAEQEHSLS